MEIKTIEFYELFRICVAGLQSHGNIEKSTNNIPGHSRYPEYTVQDCWHTERFATDACWRRNDPKSRTTKSKIANNNTKPACSLHYSFWMKPVEPGTCVLSNFPVSIAILPFFFLLFLRCARERRANFHWIKWTSHLLFVGKIFILDFGVGVRVKCKCRVVRVDFPAIFINLFTEYGTAWQRIEENTIAKATPICHSAFIS